MEKRDYLLREIEKIGLLLNMILNKLAGKDVNFATTIENQFQETKDLLLHEIGFNLEHFLKLGKSETSVYLGEFTGLNNSNIELLADVLYTEGITIHSGHSDDCLHKALLLYELCKLSDKTYSFERENKITAIKKALGMN